MVRFPRPLWLLLIPALLAAGCDTAADTEVGKATATDVRTVAAATTAAVERPISRFVVVSGTLSAQEQADVAAEIPGRIVSTPVERGTRVSAGAALVQIADAEVRAQADEAAANAAQIEARLGLAGGATFEIDRVPEVANARASSELAQMEFDRARMLVEKKLLPQADF